MILEYGKPFNPLTAPAPYGFNHTEYARGAGLCAELLQWVHENIKESTSNFHNNLGCDLASICHRNQADILDIAILIYMNYNQEACLTNSFFFMSDAFELGDPQRNEQLISSLEGEFVSCLSPVDDGVGGHGHLLVCRNFERNSGRGYKWFDIAPLMSVDDIRNNIRWKFDQVVHPWSVR